MGWRSVREHAARGLRGAVAYVFPRQSRTVTATYSCHISIQTGESSRGGCNSFRLRVPPDSLTETRRGSWVKFRLREEEALDMTSAVTPQMSSKRVGRESANGLFVGGPAPNTHRYSANVRRVNDTLKAVTVQLNQIKHQQFKIKESSPCGSSPIRVRLKSSLPYKCNCISD